MSIRNSEAEEGKTYSKKKERQMCIKDRISIEENEEHLNIGGRCEYNITIIKQL